MLYVWLYAAHSSLQYFQVHRKHLPKGQQRTSELGLTLDLVDPGDIRGKMEVCLSGFMMLKRCSVTIINTAAHASPAQAHSASTSRCDMQGTDHINVLSWQAPP